MANPRLLIVQTGTAAEPLRRTHGDYPDWFIRSLGFEMPIVRAHEGERIGGRSFDGVIVTGSPLSVMERAPWMEELGQELLRIGARGAPVLGVCFGHQLLARAAGGDVVRNPRGREIGTVTIQLTAAGAKDPLFAWAQGGTAGSTVIEAQATHVDAVEPVPPGATLLASNESSPAQAMRLSETVAGVQFHPEVSPEAMRELIASRAATLAAEGLDADALSSAVHETQAASILRAFAAQALRA
jgi:GMP synthase (glutamine-hydrolysing)